ncbi:MAG: histidine kinase [Mycobacteriales bacterium]
METLPVALAALAAAWFAAALATWRTGASRPAAWCAAASAAHVLAALWLPGTPIVLAVWLACGLAMPTGLLATTARRVIAIGCAAASAAWTAAIALSGTSDDPGGEGWFVLGALVVAVVAGFAVGIRWRGSPRDARRILEWLLATLVLSAAAATVVVALHFLVDTPEAVTPWLVGALVLVPLGQALAAWPRLRQAAGVVLVESFVVAGLTVFVVAVYLVVVIGLGEVPQGRERDVLVSSLIAAVVIAVLAMPVRQRLLGFAAPFAGGRAASAEQSLTTLGSRMTRAIPMDELLLQIAESLHATMAPAGAEIWVRHDGSLAQSISVPMRHSPRIPLGDKERVVVARARMGGPRWMSVWLPDLLDEPVPEASASGARPDVRVAPISHLGELLGLVVVRRNADAGAFSEDDEHLLVELARQLGLALHNVRLDSALQASLEELQRRNAELQASRLRIVTASDESRREIERNLHDGAQQYLVALAVKLNVAGQVAEDEPEALPAMLEELRGDVQATIRELRELAHGIYPPLLRDRGLGEALRTAVTRSPLQTTLDVDLPDRYPQDIETAVYFCCLEALQNAGKHAGADAAVFVQVSGDSGEIRFAVEDDGRGFDAGDESGHGFINMRDRLGAVGGVFTITSAAGQGTAVRGSIPVSLREGSATVAG